MIDGLFVSGELAGARRAAEVAWQRWSPVNVTWGDRFRLEAARIALYQGHSQNVLKLLDEPLHGFGDGSGQVRRDLYRSLALVRIGKTAEAQKLIAVAARQKLEPELRAEVLSTAGSVALDLDHAQRAKTLFEQSLLLSQKSGNRFLAMQVLGNLGVLALRGEQYEQASAFFERAAELAALLHAKFAHQNYVGNVGYGFYSSGDYRRAALNFKLAADEAERQGATLDLIAWLTDLSLCEFQMKHSALARAQAEKALQYATDIQNEELIGDAHLSLGSLSAHDQPGIAMRHALAALAIADVRKNRPEQLAARTLHATLLAGSDGEEQGRRELLSLARQRDLPPSLCWRVQDELGKLAEKERHMRTADFWFRSALAVYRKQRGTLRTLEFQLPFQENASDLLNGYLDHLIASGREWEALRVLDESRAEGLAGVGPGASHGQAGASLAQALARRLGGTVLVYRIRPEQSYLWAIGAGKPQFYRLQGGTDLLSLVQQHQSAILASRDLQSAGGQAARSLFQALVAPALPVIGRSDRVLILAGEALVNLNFETLLTGGAQSHFWIDDVAVSNARSLLRLAQSSRPFAGAAAGGHKLLLLGAQSVPGALYPDLPHAAEEMARVARHFAPAERTVLTGAQATPVAYKQSRPGAFRYLHFVSHGEADELQPMRSAILLNSPDGQPREFRLQSLEIAAEPLHAELVTLSACYSAGARTYSGEGLVGLAWAFQHAGARHVIGALWEVSDAATPLLMDKLYAGLALGLAPDRALRAAKLALLHGTGVSRKPYYWAPFLLY